MQVLLFPHGGSGNHGCEAIVRTTAQLTGADVVLASASPDEDLFYGVGDCCRIIKDRTTIRRGTLSYLNAALQYHARGRKDAFDRLVFQPIFDIADKCDAAFSIGGDNYCYGEQHYLYLINRELKKRHVYTVLWGCSIEPKLIHGALLEELQRYNWISARESITAEALKAKGLNHVTLYPDPAFTLGRKKTPLPDNFVKKNTVGVNISPMILNYGISKDTVLFNYSYLIERILKETDMSVALIPHVVRPHNDDREPLSWLYEKFKESNRIFQVSDRPAEELKEIISQCRFMVAARTHASIAAYSENVPTLAVGYSVKARGIARDIFGTETRFVLPVQSMTRHDNLWSSFRWLMEEEDAIRGRYQVIMADYIKRAIAAGLYFKGK